MSPFILWAVSAIAYTAKALQDVPSLSAFFLLNSFGQQAATCRRCAVLAVLLLQTEVFHFVRDQFSKDCRCLVFILVVMKEKMSCI